MSKKQARRLSEDERAERHRADRERLKRAAEELLTSEGWRRWVRVRASFYSYSAGNCMLLALQCHQRGIVPQHIAGFRAWLKLGRCVRKGQGALRILAPVTVKRTDGLEDADQRRVFFKTAFVFDVSQTEPLPGVDPVALEPPREPLTGDSHGHLLAPLEALAGSLGYSVSFETISRFILISDAQSINAQVNAWCHELAHALVHDGREDGDPDLGYAEEELAAQSVAQIAVSFVGLDASEFTIGYLAAWSESAAPDTFEQIGQLVDRLARRLEETLISSDPGSETSDGGAEVAAV